MDDVTIKDDELDLDDIDLTKAPIPALDDELEDVGVVGDPDIVSIDDLADAEEEEEEEMFDEDEM